jgi:hypothetical protein
MEACRVVMTLTDAGVIDVGAPMKHKDLCYEILAEASHVIKATPEQHFKLGQRTLTLVMGMSGTVDVAAPLPPRILCEKMLEVAKHIIERFDDEAAPVMRPFADVLMGV